MAMGLVWLNLSTKDEKRHHWYLPMARMAFGAAATVLVALLVRFFATKEKPGFRLRRTVALAALAVLPWWVPALGVSGGPSTPGAGGVEQGAPPTAGASDDAS